MSVLADYLPGTANAVRLPQDRQLQTVVLPPLDPGFGKAEPGQVGQVGVDRHARRHIPRGVTA